MEATTLPRLRPPSLPRRMLAALDDARVVEHVRRGNTAAFEVLYDRHHAGILAYARHLLGSREEAEDAVQHTFASAYGALMRGQQEIRLKPWLYTIARNRCLTVLRARREQPAELDDVATAGLSEHVQQRDDLRLLLADLQDLPEPQRAALVLAEVSGLGHPEIADVLGCEVPKVKSLVFQARSGLMERRQARETPCQEIREQLSVLTGGSLRRGPLRRHLKACPGCSAYRDEVKRQRQMLALALPVVPTVALKESVLAAAGIGGAAAAGGGAAAAGGGAAAGAALGGAGLAGGGASVGGGLSTAAAAIAAKAGVAKAVVAALAGTAALGGGTYALTSDPGPAAPAESMRQAAPAEGSPASGSAPAGGGLPAVPVAPERERDSERRRGRGEERRSERGRHGAPGSRARGDGRSAPRGSGRPGDRARGRRGAPAAPRGGRRPRSRPEPPSRGQRRGRATPAPRGETRRPRPPAQRPFPAPAPLSQPDDGAGTRTDPTPVPPRPLPGRDTADPGAGG